jgi:hypothetical protein
LGHEGCLNKHYSSVVGKALPAIEFGMIARPYEVKTEGKIVAAALKKREVAP